MSLYSRAAHKLKSIQWDVKNRVYESVLRKLDLEALLESGVRVKVANYADWSIYTSIFADGEYDPPIQAALAQTPQDSRLNVLDLGANVGFFALRVAHLLTQRGHREFCVVCVEASPATYVELEQRLLASPALDGRYQAVHGLVGQREGMGRIYPASFHAMTSSVQKGRIEGVEVPFVDLETLLASGDSIALLKCDIEGSEGEFLQHYHELLRRTQVAVFEIHHDKCDAASFRDQLATLGFAPPRMLRKDAFNTLEFFQRSRT